MLGKIKALGLALVAVLAIGALVAPASGASAAEFHSSEEVTELEGTQTEAHEFVVNTGVYACEVATFTGVLEGTTAEALELLPEYSECQLAGLFASPVSVNGCKYLFYAESETEGPADIGNCNEGAPYIELGTTITCRARFGEQSGGPAVTYEEVTEEKVKVHKYSLKVVAHLEALAYEESGLLCAGSGGENGTYVGTSNVYGNEGAAELSVS